MGPDDISVLICAYTLDRWDDILGAVRSVQEQTPSVHEIILVVDHNDELRRRAEETLTDIRVIENTNERGLSGARNAGLDAASGRIVAFLDDDAVATPGWAAELAAGYADERVLGVGGVSEPNWISGRPAWFPSEFDWVVGCTYVGVPTETAPVRNMIGSNMSFRRDVFTAIGGFDTTVGRVGANPVGCEETELCIRAAARWPGTHLIHEPQARVRHTVPASRGSLRYFLSRCFAEGRSKARVTKLSGASAGLATERRYATRVLPRGVVNRLGEAASTRRGGPLAAAAAIMAGLGYTTAGYTYGMLFERRPTDRGRVSAQRSKSSNGGG
jgi:glycosyltransferase involved in cell wall biosynthesis